MMSKVDMGQRNQRLGTGSKGKYYTSNMIKEFE